MSDTGSSSNILVTWKCGLLAQSLRVCHFCSLPLGVVRLHIRSPLHNVKHRHSDYGCFCCCLYSLNMQAVIGCWDQSVRIMWRFAVHVALQQCCGHAKEPAKSRLGHCDLDSPQPINCQCEMPHHNYLFMIIFLSPVLLF